MLNHITIQGRLTDDPELKTTGKGISVVSFSIASKRDFVTKDGEETDFIDVVAWRGDADFISNYFKKGNLIIVEGSLRMEKWVDKKDGSPRVSYKIHADKAHFSESKKHNPETASSEISDDSSSDFDPFH